MDALRAAYLDLMMDEPGTPLNAFMERVARGDYGAHTTEQLADFLRAVEHDTVASIEAQAAAHPGLAGHVEERVEDARAEIDALLRRYAAHPS